MSWRHMGSPMLPRPIRPSLGFIRPPLARLPAGPFVPGSAACGRLPGVAPWGALGGRRAVVRGPVLSPGGLLVEVHVLRLGAPRRAGEHEQGAYHQQGQRRVLEGHEAREAGLVEGVERRRDDRQTVAEAEARGPDAGPEALVDVCGREAPRRGHNYKI